MSIPNIIANSKSAVYLIILVPRLCLIKSLNTRYRVMVYISLTHGRSTSGCTLYLVMSEGNISQLLDDIVWD